MVISDRRRHASSAPSPATMAAVGRRGADALVDAILCFPSIFLLLALAAFIEPGLVAMITVIIAATGWMEVARIVEAQIRTLREREFAVAAEMLGASRTAHHVPRASAATPSGRSSSRRRSRSRGAILLEAYISFLGYGIQPPTGELGQHAQ